MHACENKEKYEVFSSITRHSQGKISLRFSPRRETVLQLWRVVFVFGVNLKLVINLRNDVINIEDLFGVCLMEEEFSM